MKFLIGDKQYDAEEGLSKVSLATLYELKVKTGIGMKTLAGMAQKLGTYTDPMDLLEDKDSFRALMIVIWLARRHAGEHLSLEESSSFPLDEFRLVDEERPEEAEPDPKAPAASAPADEPEATTATT